MQVVTVTPMYGYVKHAAPLTPGLQKWMDESSGGYTLRLGYAHNIPIRTVCSRRPGSTKAVDLTPFESLENEVTETIWAKKQNSVCAKCQRILREMKQKEKNDN